MSKITFKLVPAQDIPDAFDIEQLGFPLDEAADLQTLADRQFEAGDLFLGAYSGMALIGYACATQTQTSTLHHSSMSTHVPGAPYAAIHSVCVHPDYRGQGIALSLLKAYVARLSDIPQIKGARLITHSELIPFYTKAAFELVGESSIVHGARKWFEMKIDFGGVSAVEALATKAKAQEEVARQEKAVQAGTGDDVHRSLDEEKQGLQVAQPPAQRNPGQAWAAFDGKLESLVDGDGLNRAGLYCPRPECRCLLLRPGAGKWVLPSSNEFELPHLPHPVGTAPPVSSASGYWSVPSPLSFENIGFSRNATLSQGGAPAPAAAGQVKFLTCADCDHGPLGWHDTEGRDLGAEVQDENEGKLGKVRTGREFLLAADRVRYKV